MGSASVPSSQASSRGPQCLVGLEPSADPPHGLPLTWPLGRAGLLACRSLAVSQACSSCGCPHGAGQGVRCVLGSCSLDALLGALDAALGRLRHCLAWALPWAADRELRSWRGRPPSHARSPRLQEASHRHPTEVRSGSWQRRNTLPCFSLRRNNTSSPAFAPCLCMDCLTNPSSLGSLLFLCQGKLSSLRVWDERERKATDATHIWPWVA